MLKTFLVMAMAVASQAAAPEGRLRLPAIFGDHMVIQQGAPVRVWGHDAPGQRVSVGLAGAVGSAVADAQGRFSVELPSLPAGGPHTLMVTGSTSRAISDVLVGEVWLGSGQSNMEFALRLSSDAAETLKKADQPGMRLFTVERKAAFSPQDDLAGEWKVCTPETAAEFSAVLYHLGLRLHQELGRPVGLVAASWGGTPAEDWTPRAALDADPRFAATAKEWDKAPGRVALWKKGLPFSLEIKSLRLIPKDPKAEPREVALDGPRPGALGGAWTHYQKPDSRSDYAFTDGAGVFSGVVQGSAWAGASTDLEPGRGVDLSDIDAVELVARGTGKYTLSLGQATITDSDFHAAPAFELKADWDTFRFPLDGFKQGGWGLPKPFTPGAITRVAFSVQVDFWPDLPSVAYNGMIAPLTPMPIAGVAWYQGESNEGRSLEYGDLLTALITSWRRAWGREALPFLVVELPDYKAPELIPTESGWAQLREGQRQALKLPATAVVTTLGLGDTVNVHPTRKSEVGRRLSLAALKVAYGRSVEHRGPDAVAARLKDGKVWVDFTAPSGLRARDGELKGFALLDGEGQWHWAKAKIHGSQVEVWSDEAAQPVKVRYAWSDNPGCNLEGKSGLAAAGFQMDVRAEGQNAGSSK